LWLRRRIVVFSQRTNSISGIEFRELQLSELQFDRDSENPRMGVNEVREEIKSSIKNTLGRYVVLEVSRRPNEQSYCLHRGGNTRLEVLKELAIEWEGRDVDNPYKSVKCMVFPWVDDTEKSILGVTENIVRGSLCYAEESRAVAILHEQYKNSVQNEDVGQVSFLDWSQSLGMSMKLDSGSISRYLATNRFITPYMPKLMIEGRSKGIVARYILDEKASVYTLFRDRKGDEPSRDEIVIAKEETEKVCKKVFQSCDALTLDKKVMAHCIVSVIREQTGEISDSERRLFVSQRGPVLESFANRYRISDEKPSFTQDNKRNAAILLVDALGDKEILSANKRTRALNKMNVTDDLSGFFKLVGHLDVGGRNMVARMLKEA